MESPRVRADRSPTRCPYCREELDKLEELAACAACGARHHQACHTEHGSCASCGASEVLVSASQARARRRLQEPPKGSRIRVESTGDATEYRWEPGGKQDAVLLILFTVLLITMPLALWVFYRNRKDRDALGVRLTPEAIEFQRQHGASWRQHRIAREDLGAVRVMTQAGVTVLYLDEGIERRQLYTSAMQPALKAPELEWLAEVIMAWRDQS
jgi:hypothetical protein